LIENREKNPHVYKKNYLDAENKFLHTERALSRDDDYGEVRVEGRQTKGNYSSLVISFTTQSKNTFNNEQDP
jgi:hypothetical protein